MVKFKEKFNNFITRINLHTEKIGAPYELFGLFAIITYPAYYFILTSLKTVDYENIWLRLITVPLCLPLVFKNRWPNHLSRYFYIYWYLTLLYCLPFLFTFLALKNHLSDEVCLNTITILVLSILLIDLVVLAIILPAGIFLGWICFKLTSPTFEVPIHVSYPMLISYLSVLLFGALFARSKEITQNGKFQATKSLAASIAHELRTPLRTIRSSIGGIKEYLPLLFHGYNLAQKVNLPVTSINPLHYEALIAACQDIDSEVQSALLIIEMLLANVQSSDLKPVTLESLRMSDCIQNALSRYPFDILEREKICLELRDDFYFYGEKTLITHIFFNLIKNSLYYLKASGKEDCKIRIWMKVSEQKNVVYFNDSGTGITAEHLRHIFTPFYSQTLHGAGVGLTFCKVAMQLMQGSIVCFSKQGEYTEFALRFPKIDSLKIP